MIKLNKELRSHLLLHNIMFVILFIIGIILLGYLAFSTRVHWDISQNGRNSLSQASLSVLEKLKGTIEITAYATEQDARLGNIRRVISDFILLYQRFKPDITLTFVNPVEQPKLAQEAGVNVNGEMVVDFNGRREHLTVINEQVFTNLLMRLARNEEKQIMVLAGHGERKLNGSANYDLGEFGLKLSANGFNSKTINLAVEQDIPSNASMLIIASPQADLMEGEVDMLLDYIDRGGNLLWLIDQEPLRGLLPLAEKLHLTLSPGIVVDPQAQQLKAPITFALGVNYGQHAITRHFEYITVFPFARQIIMNESEEWYGVPLVEVAPDGWVESGELDGDISFDQLYDVAGPVNIACALSRTAQDHEQRIVVVGSGHFLANNYLGNGGNLDFGVNLINWLAGDENLISIQPRATRDSNLMLSESSLSYIVFGSLIVLPLFFLLCGMLIWWRRRRR